MKNESDHEKLSEHIKFVLDASVDQLDAKSRYQLQQRRAKVLNGEVKSSVRSKWPVFGSVAAFASIAALAVFLIVSPVQNRGYETNFVTGLDSILFEADANMELYEQYDFYVWLAQEESNG